MPLFYLTTAVSSVTAMGVMLCMTGGYDTATRGQIGWFFFFAGIAVMSVVGGTWAR